MYNLVCTNTVVYQQYNTSVLVPIAYVCSFFLSSTRYRAMFDVIEMPLHWPVDVNYHEAKAFCLWKGPEYRLPTEAEHHRMRGEDVRIAVSYV